MNKNSNHGEQTLLETPDELVSRFSRERSGLVTIKPRVLFEKIERSLDKPAPLNLHVPSSGIGSITLLEGAALVSLLHLLQPRKVFEFGTFLGYSTALMLRNTPDDCEVCSIDLGEVADQFEASRDYTVNELHTDDKKNDDYLRYVQSTKGLYYLSDLSPTQKSRLKLIHGDSREFDISRYGLNGNVDFVFIDGGHDYATVQSDFEKASAMVGDDGVIVWHDFNSTIHRDVTEMVEKFSEEELVLHVQHTMLAIFLKGAARDRFLNAGIIARSKS